MIHWLSALSIAGITLGIGFVRAPEPLRVLELRVQKADGITYFHVRLHRPMDLRLPAFDTTKPFSESDRRSFARLPRLTPQDDKTRAVFYRHRPSQPGLSFCGQLAGAGKARFLLVYPLAQTDGGQPVSLPDSMSGPGTAEVPVELDFTTARMIPTPKIDPEDLHVNRDDLRSYWALHEAAHLAVLETQALDFPFYSFAREAVGRKYGVVATAWVKRQDENPEHQLYEITTGADAIAETLQLHRMLQSEARPAGERNLDLSQVQGVTVPEQPWDRLLSGKRPVLEPLAHLIPYDNYYVHFKSIHKLVEFGELLDQWGTVALWSYEMKSRDCRLRERYEKQLCLKSTVLGKTLGPLVIKGLAVTGNDPYVREGSDVTVIFQVANRPLFLAAVDGFVAEARREHGSRLREGRVEHHGTTIETFVTPFREVSLHRALVGDCVIYSNSPIGVRRVLDAHRNALQCLADTRDFQYMRTVFPPDDKEEDGFVYLSDAFLRQLMGPASRIKGKRRLEALTSLYMVTNAALFHAWETGKLPLDHASAMNGAGLRLQDIAVPDGKGVRWDAERRLAVADVYGAISFATPLIELSIDKVTVTEAKEYTRFRDEYSKLWRTYFDPIGLKLSLDAQRVRVETHILPLAGSEQYRTLRDIAGKGTFRFEPRPEDVVDFRLSVGANEAIAFHVAQSAFLREMVELLIRWETDPRINLRTEYDRLFWKLPLGISLSEAIPDGVQGFVNLLEQIASDKVKISRYRKTDLYQVPISEDRYRKIAAVLEVLQTQTQFATLLAVIPTQEAPPVLYVAAIDKTIYVSANEDFLKELTDEAEARRKPGSKAAELARESNAGLYIRPSNARAAVGLYLEYEGRSLALLNNEVWNLFYQTGLLPPDAPAALQNETTRRFLGFVPVSPDGSSYQYDARHGEVVNGRHGSPRQPRLHKQVAEGSELRKLLDQITSLRAELRFQDNGLHAALTIDRR